MEKKQKIFRGWYIVFFAIGGLHLLLSLTMFPKYADLGIVTIVLGVLILAVPVLLMIISASKAKKVAVVPPAAPDPQPDPKPKIFTFSFSVENTRAQDRQDALRKAEDIIVHGDVFDIPAVKMYFRGTEDEPAYAVYLDSDRIGDVDPSDCEEVMRISNTMNLVGLPYEIEREYNPIADDLLYGCTVTMRYQAKE